MESQELREDIRDWAVRAFTQEFGDGLQTGLPADKAMELLSKCHTYGRGFRAGIILMLAVESERLRKEDGPVAFPDIASIKFE